MMIFSLALCSFIFSTLCVLIDQLLNTPVNHAFLKITIAFVLNRTSSSLSEDWIKFQAS